MTAGRPIVLCFSGHDPSGGAGLQADIETIASHRCHPASIVTALTVQDSRNVGKLLPQPAKELLQQAETLLADFNVAAIKIGLIGSAENAAAIARLIGQCPNIPVVLDPVLAAGGGAELADKLLLEVICDQLLPLTTLITPNTPEARRLTGKQDLAECALALQSQGVDSVLITGSHEETLEVHNRLFMPDGLTETFTWQRLPGSYHGSGCTLASAAAALLAQGLDLFTAVNEAQEYTWQSLAAAYRSGQGQLNPNRLFWMDQ